MTEENRNNSWYTPSFNDTTKDWQPFEKKFLTYAVKKGCEDIITGEVEVPKMQYETTGTSTKRKKKPFTNADEKKIYDLSVAAYSDLLIAINVSTANGLVALNLVSTQKKGGDYPQGDVKEAWVDLQKAYSITGASKQFELTTEWDDFQMNENESPITYLARLKAL